MRNKQTFKALRCKKCKNKIILTNDNIKYYDNLKYCSKHCWYSSAEFKEECSKGGKIGGPIGGRKIQELYPNQCSENGKKSAITNRKNKTGMFFDKKLQSKGGKNVTFKTHSRGGSNSQKTLKERKLCFYNSEAGNRGRETEERLSLGFYNPEVRIKAGLAAQTVLRHNIRNLLFKGQYYDSIPEIEISICLQEQYKYIPKENKTLHVRIGKCEYDFLIEKLKLFIEFHQWFKSETEEQYYSKRKNNLVLNKYGDYYLIIIK